MTLLLNSNVFRFEDDNGDPLVGGLVYTYSSGTTTPKTTYQDAGLTTPNTNPIVLNARGECTLFLGSGAYTITVKTAAGVTIKSQDGIIDSAADKDSTLRSDLANKSDATKGPALSGFNPTLNYVAGTIGGHLIRDAFCPMDFPWLAKFDGITDDAAAINACATAARSGPRAIRLPDGVTASVGSSLDFSGLHVVGHVTVDQVPHIRATSAQFDVITTTGHTTLQGIYVHGGWDGITAGLSGDILSIKATSPAYPYNVHLRDCVFQYAKKRHIYWERGGYSSVWNVKCNAAGLHSLELFGNPGGGDSTTTVMIGGFSVFSDCPNGYGVKMTECINVTIDGAIAENTKGIQIAGLANRAIGIRTFYQENTSGGKFVDWAGSSGIGFELRGCFGGGHAIDYNANWLNQFYGGNSNLAEPALPIDSYRILLVDGGEQTTAVAGSVTAASISLPPGTWDVRGYVQTVNSVGGTITQLAAQITTNNAASGLNNSTSALAFGADEATYDPGASTDLRVRPSDVVQNTTSGNVTYYLRALIGRTAGTIAYRGALKAIRIS